MEWQNEEGISVTISNENNHSFDLDWRDNGHLKETDYYDSRRREVDDNAGCTGICIPLPGNNEYGNHTITIEFVDGTTKVYDLPSAGRIMLRELQDYIGTQYEIVPGRSEMATAARLLDDEMMYEI